VFELGKPARGGPGPGGGGQIFKNIFFSNDFCFVYFELFSGIFWEFLGHIAQLAKGQGANLVALTTSDL
jgi:hypothetical protein